MENESDAAVISASFADPGRFGAIFDRHATILFRYLVRRVGVDEAEALLGDVFRIAFEKRAAYDCERPTPGPGSTASRPICSRITAAPKRAGSGRPHVCWRAAARRTT